MRWKPINTQADCPKDEYYDDPPQHILRGKLDDPRAGWQVIQCTAEEMLEVAKQFDRAEYLDESTSSDPAEVLELRQWKKEAMELLNPIMEYGRTHPDIKLGSSTTQFVLNRAKAAELLVKALKEIASPISRLTKKEIKYLADAGLKSYEQLKQQ